MTTPTGPSTAPAPDPIPIDLAADHAAAALLAVAVAAVLHLLNVVGRALVPAWPASPLLPLVGTIVTLMAFYRHRWARLYRPYGSRMPIYVAELVALLVLTRLASLVLDPPAALTRVPGWWAEPTTIVDLVFAVDALFVGSAWLIGHSVGSLVDQLHLQPGELAPPRGTAPYAQWERTQAAIDHRGAQRQVAYLVAAAGVVVIIALALLALAQAPAAAMVEAVVAAVVTLACGLLLLGWAQVTLLDTLWRLDGLAGPGLLRGRWAGWLLATIAAVGLLALVLPRTYVVDPLALLAWLLVAVTGAFQLLLFLLMLPFIWLASLLGITSGGGGAITPPPIAAVPDRTETDWSLLAVLRSLGFWLLTLALTVYAVRTLYQSRWGILRYLPRIAVWGRLAAWWRGLLAGARERGGALASLVRERLRPRSATATLRPRRAPRPTDPRGLVQFLYLSLIDRAGRRGLPRRRGMTAAEYSRYLATRLAADVPDDSRAVDGQPSAVVALDTLTAAYLEARYSRHSVGDGDVGRARRALQRLLQLIRQRSSRAGSPPTE